MKLTPNAAMRARDVSRPRAEHLAEAEAAEAAVGSRARTDAASQSRGEDKAKTPRPQAAGGDERGGRPRFPRRRRGRAPR